MPGNTNDSENNKNNSEQKVTIFRRYSWLNIGTILFLAILIYMIITVIIFATTKHVSVYEVTWGSISGDYRYSALAVRNEEIVTADYSGYVTYYAREGSRIGAGSPVCSISETDSAESTAEPVELTDEDYDEIRSESTSFVSRFDLSSFQNVYSYKSDLESYILSTQQNADASPGTLDNEMDAPESGFVLYRVDGMENLTDDQITADLFNTNNYEFTNLRLNTQVTAGDSVYKLALGEDWTLYFPLSDELASELASRDTIRFRFLSDDEAFNGRYTEFKNGDQWYGKISMDNSLVRYVSERYVEIELDLSTDEGLKVPTSSIASREFHVISSDFVTVNEDSDTEVNLIIQSFNADGSERTTNKTVQVYEHRTEDSRDEYLISTDDISTGDRIIAPNSTNYYEVTDSDLVSIQGVYNVNEGYAIFRTVQIIDQNEEFCIVKPDNTYGLSAHDYIALDASTVNEGDII